MPSPFPHLISSGFVPRFTAAFSFFNHNATNSVVGLQFNLMIYLCLCLLPLLIPMRFPLLSFFSGPGAACFPNAPPPLASLHNKEGGIAFGMWENKGITRTKKMLVAETDKMLYLGQPVVRNPSKYLRHPALCPPLLFFLC